MRDSRPLFLLAGALALSLVVSGCSKKKEEASGNPAPEQANQTTAAPTVSAVMAAPAAARQSESPVVREANTGLEDLQLQVDAYQKVYKRKPASLEQMVREGFMNAVPPAPAGRRFVYDPSSGRVNLVPR